MGLVTWLLVVVGAVLALAVIRGLIDRVVVYEYQQGLRYSNGLYRGLVGPGEHWIYTPTTTIRTVDMRLSLLAAPGQEVIASDGISIKLTIAGQYRLTDPAVAINQVQDYLGTMYNLIQVALREVVGARTIDDVLQHRETIGPEVVERAASKVHDIGVELVDVEIKDLMLPAATKRLFAQVVDARQQGLASLEKARGETAALRSLANAARLVEQNPAMLQLRMLHQLETTSGNTVVLGLSPSAVPLPRTGSSIAEPDPEA